MVDAFTKEIFESYSFGEKKLKQMKKSHVHKQNCSHSQQHHIFDPKNDMDLSKQDRESLNTYEAYQKQKWFITVAKL